MKLDFNTLGIDIGSTTVKIAILNKDGEIIFSDYQRHYANIQETLASLLKEANVSLLISVSALIKQIISWSPFRAP